MKASTRAARKHEKKLTVEQRRRIYCVKHGHSRLLDSFMGYHYCCRCGDQLGDSWGGVFRDDSAVYVHHMHLWTHKPEEFAKVRGCKCPENAKTLLYMDFTLVPQWSSWGYEQRPPWREKPRAAPAKAEGSESGNAATTAAPSSGSSRATGKAEEAGQEPRAPNRGES